jgi:hypothetical protein
MDVTDVVAGYSAAVAQRTEADASMSMLRKAIDAESSAAAQLLEAMPEPARLPPLGNLGHHLDVRV